MTTRYIIIDEELGIFLGTHNPQMGTYELPKSYALFAANDPFLLTEAFSFSSEEEAQEFIENVNRKGLSCRPIQSDKEYVHLVDIIKAGYGDYTFEMLEGMEGPSSEIH